MSAASADHDIRQADAIIHARWLIPMTEKGLVLHDHSLVIKGHTIMDILPRAEVHQHYRADEEFDLDSHAVMPGLINAHGHSPMTLLRGFADDMPLKVWLEEKIWPTEGKWVNETFVADGAELAMAEMLLGGTTTFTDMYFFPDHIARTALKANMRVLLASPVLDFPTVWAQDAEEYIHKATSLHDHYKNNEHVRVAFGPHATYTVSDEPLKKIGTLANELDIPVHIHLHETAEEIAESVAGIGKRPLARLADLGLVTPNLQCVHMTQIENDEIELLAENDAMVIHCPASNMKLASGACPVHTLLDKGIDIALGTDGCASNNELNMLSEMRLTALAGKRQAGNPVAVPAWDVLFMATRQGARAIGLADKTGALEKGKFADIAAFDLDHINTQPVYDPVSTLIYSARANQVSHVWVGGRLNVRDGRLTHLDLNHLLNKARDWGEKIRQA